MQWPPRLFDQWIQMAQNDEVIQLEPPLAFTGPSSPPSNPPPPSPTIPSPSNNQDPGDIPQSSSLHSPPHSSVARSSPPSPAVVSGLGDDMYWQSIGRIDEELVNLLLN